MRLPIVAYGDPVLKRKGVEISSDYPELKQLIANMFETMDGARGVGLAAQQIGLSIRLFVVDATAYADDEEDGDPALADFRKVFINPIIIEERGEPKAFNEGCLSIPDIREDVMRKPIIVLRYQDENFEQHEQEYTGMAARIIQHEYDHIEGKLFTDYLSPLRKARLKSRFDSITRGKVQVDYKMRFPLARKR